MKKNLMGMVKAAAFAAVVCVATMLVPVPLPAGGYANAGDAIVIASGFFCGAWYGFLAAAVGSALADIFLGAAVYAPATFVIKGIMALVVAVIIKNVKNKKSFPAIIISSILAEIVMILGYFLYELVIYGFVGAATDVWGNTIQGCVGFVLATVLISVLTRVKGIDKVLKI